MFIQCIVSRELRVIYELSFKQVGTNHNYFKTPILGKSVQYSS